MCNLYSMTRNVDAILRLFGADAGRDHAGNPPSMPEAVRVDPAEGTAGRRPPAIGTTALSAPSGAGKSSSSASSSDDSTTTDSSDVSSILQDFLKALKDARSSQGYSATGASSTSSSLVSSQLHYQA